MGNWFTGLDLGAKYAMALAVLFTLVMAFAFFKLWLIKRRERRFIKAKNLTADDEENTPETVALAARMKTDTLEEGDLFGIRALEHGFTGGVAQSRPSTPTSSTVNLVYPGTGRIPYGQTGSTSSMSLSHASPVRPVDMTLNVPESPRISRMGAGTPATRSVENLRNSSPTSPRSTMPMADGGHSSQTSAESTEAGSKLSGSQSSGSHSSKSSKSSTDTVNKANDHTDDHPASLSKPAIRIQKPADDPAAYVYYPRPGERSAVV